jgi:hypothetical protein
MPEIHVEQKGPSNAVLVLAMVAAIILSFAVWTISAQVGAAVLAVGIGIGVRNALVGMAHLVSAAGTARARVIEAHNQPARLVEGQRPRLLED